MIKKFHVNPKTELFIKYIISKTPLKLFTDRFVNKILVLVAGCFVYRMKHIL